ncbi:MAG TPA: DUF971 domain-containing protein [Phycisphaerae bacterium]|jgi:DUF971 family protein|nr:DUF971 domain-containing protein [Phycisphaerae bacterium]
MTPTALHLKKTEALLITWDDGRESAFPLRLLRKHCPCAGCQGERDILGRTLMPIVKTTYDGPITATGAALVGNYALRIDWADGHNAGIYTFAYLRELDALYAAEREPPVTKPAREGTDIRA